MNEPAAVPEYADTRDHLLDELVRIDLLLRRRLEAWWADEDPQRDEFTGLFVSDEEVDGLLLTDAEAAARVRGPETGSAEPRETDGRLESVTAFVRQRATQSIEAGVELRLFSLAAAFNLSALEVEALLLALAPDIDPKYEKVYGYLRDDVTTSRPTVDLLLRVLTHTDEERLAVMEVFSDRSTLVRAGLVRVEKGPTIPSSEVRVEARVIEYLLGSEKVAGPLSDVVTVVEPGAAASELFLDAERRQAIEYLAQQRSESNDNWTAGDIAAHPLAARTGNAEGGPPMGRNESATEESPSRERPLLAAFVGPDERAAEVAVNRVCREAGIPMLRISAAWLSSEQADLRIVRREACLQSAAIHVTSLDALEDHRPSPFGESQDPSQGSTEERIESLLAALDRFPGDVFLTGDALITADLQSQLDRHRFKRVAFPRPDYAQRKAIWAAIEELPAGADPETLAGTFRLTRGGIEAAVETARSLTDGALTVAAINEACRLLSRGELDDLATAIEPTYDWDDIVLPEPTLAHLRELAGAVRHRDTVYDEWGFADRFSLGNGINLLFTGKSGTGKTMAAEIIAGDVGLPLYKLDLSRIISKYIGETEKNLGRVFDAAEDSNAILFFDEADALFGTRTEISDSHDRYANVEVDYLLQRMEEHDGCVIMATNLAENVDDAFQRRINATIDFPMPDEDARREIWGLIFPAETPIEELDIEFLAGFELSGGSIKNVALTAAFLAAEDGEAVGMEHLARALRREFQKTGKLYDLNDFGEYVPIFD